MTNGRRTKAAAQIEERPVRGWPMFLFLLAVLGVLIAFAVISPPGSVQAMGK